MSDLLRNISILLFTTLYNLLPVLSKKFQNTNQIFIFVLVIIFFGKIIVNKP